MTNSQIQAIAQYRKDGMTWQEIADCIGVAKPTIYRIVKKSMPELLQEKTLNAEKVDRLQTIIKLRNNGLTWQEIADEFGMTKSSAYMFAKHNIPELLQEKVLNDERIAKLQAIIKLRDAGLTWQEVGDKFGLKQNAVRVFVARHMPEYLQSKQSTKIQTIINYRNDGMTWQQIADEYGVTKQAIYYFAKQHMPELLGTLNQKK